MPRRAALSDYAPTPPPPPPWGRPLLGQCAPTPDPDRVSGGARADVLPSVSHSWHVRWPSRSYRRWQAGSLLVANDITTAGSPRWQSDPASSSPASRCSRGSASSRPAAAVVPQRRPEPPQQSLARGPRRPPPRLQGSPDQPAPACPQLRVPKPTPPGTSPT